jgi:hypothetical protein
MNPGPQERLLRNVSVSKGNTFGPGNCIIIPGAQEGQTATGPFTLTFDTNDVLTNVIPGASFFFENRKFESCRIDSSNSADTLIQVQAGFGRKYLPPVPGATPLPPGPSIPVQEVFGTRLDASITATIGPGAASSFGIINWQLAKRVYFSLAPGSPGCIWLQSKNVNGTFPVGLPIYPGEPRVLTAADGYSPPVGDAEYFIYNPNSVTIDYFLLVEYYS